MAAAHATTTSYKCRRCRQMLCLSSCIVDSHGELAKEVSSCALDTSNPDPLAGLLFLDSDKLPEWLTVQIDEGEWSKGRIHCPKCRARIGLFDFITGSKCGCLQYVLPGIQINKSKVDHHVPRPLQSSVVTPTRSYTCTEAKESGADVGVGMLTNRVSQPECVSIENTASHVAGLETEPVLHSSVAASESAGSLSQRNLSSVTCYQTSPHADTESISPRVTMDENTVSDTWGGSANTVDAPDPSCCEIAPSNAAMCNTRSGVELLGRECLANMETAEIRRETVDVKPREECVQNQRCCSDSEADRCHLTCAICWELYHHAMSVRPCGHIFCEGCLRGLTRYSRTSATVACPLCRTVIMCCVSEPDLDAVVRTRYPREQLQQDVSRKNLRLCPLPATTRLHAASQQQPRDSAAGVRWVASRLPYSGVRTAFCCIVVLCSVTVNLIGARFYDYKYRDKLTQAHISNLCVLALLGGAIFCFFVLRVARSGH